MRFRASSIFLSAAADSLPAISPDDEVEGVVVGFSDSGNQPLVFALVEFVRKQTVVVPVRELHECH